MLSNEIAKIGYKISTKQEESNNNIHFIDCFIVHKLYLLQEHEQFALMQTQTEKTYFNKHQNKINPSYKIKPMFDYVFLPLNTMINISKQAKVAS